MNLNLSAAHNRYLYPILTNHLEVVHNKFKPNMQKLFLYNAKRTYWGQFPVMINFSKGSKGRRIWILFWSLKGSGSKGLNNVEVVWGLVYEPPKYCIEERVAPSLPPRFQPRPAVATGPGSTSRASTPRSVPSSASSYRSGMAIS